MHNSVSSSGRCSVHGIREAESSVISTKALWCSGTLTSALTLAAWSGVSYCSWWCSICGGGTLTFVAPCSGAVLVCKQRLVCCIIQLLLLESSRHTQLHTHSVQGCLIDRVHTKISIIDSVNVLQCPQKYMHTCIHTHRPSLLLGSGHH